ncbi:MAG: signal peptidase I [Oscillospiraceae bacterium]|nr:signal peptidase I [Oscillospiraceae bacterium]
MAENKPERSLWLDVYNVLSDLVSCLVFVTILFVFAIRLVGVDGQSMYPTLQDGDRLTLLSNFIYRPEIGDIVVLKAPGFEQGPLVKRVIAMDGQTVDIDFETGDVRVDGVLLDEPYINDPTTRYEGVNFPLTVPEGYVFVMGDNRLHSSDSRDPSIGCIDKRYVLGKALQVIYPISRFGGVS